MRVALLSKALVSAAYQTKCEALAALPDIDLSVIVPPSWRDRRGWDKVLERDETAGYELIETPIALNGHFHLHFYPRVGSHLRRIRPNLFHVDEEPFNLATFHAMWLGRRLGVRMVFYAWANIERRLPPPFSSFERHCFAWSCGAFAGNRGAAERLRARGFTGPIEIIPQFGVDTRSFTPATAAHTDPFTVGYAGRLIEEKGVQILLRAVAALRCDWRLIIMGEGEHRHSLETLARGLGVGARVRFLAPVSPLRVPDVLRTLDTLVLPSITTPTWKEQFGRILIEAMACRIPVVGSDSGEIPHVIGDAGMVVPEGDPAALAAALQMLNDDPLTRAHLADAGRRHVLLHYTQKAIATRYHAAYRRLLAETADPASPPTQVDDILSP